MRGGLDWLNQRMQRAELEPLPVDAWLREGALRPLLATSVLLSTFPLAGVVRTLTRAPIVPSFIVAVLVVAAFTVPLLPAFRARYAGAGAHTAIGLACAAVIALFACYCLYSRYFAGLTNYRGTDGGFHVSYYHDFVRTAPDSYNRFVSMYAALYFIQHLLHLNVFWAFVVVFYGEVLLVAALPVAVTFSLLWPLRSARSAYTTAAAAMVPIALAVQYFVILPQQHQNQADGFYPHLFGMLPLFAVWLIHALVRAPVLRQAALLVAFVAYRFTYGLNVGDLALALAVIAALDASHRGHRRGWRIANGVLAAAYAATALLAYRALWSVHTLSGHVVAYDVRLAILAEALGVAALASVAVVYRREPIRQAALFPLVFGAINILGALGYMLTSAPRIYYFYKYPMAALFVVASGCVAVLPAALAGAIARRPAGSIHVRVTVAASLAFVLTSGAVSAWYHSMPLYRVGFLERAWGKPPFLTENNLPLADLGAWSRIHKTLREHNKRFGGYVVSQFGMMIFMNAALEVPNFGWSTWFAGPQVPPPPGYCIFWDEGSPRGWWIWEFLFPLKQLRAQLERDTAKQCTRYRAHWDPDGPPRVLCSHCY